MDQTPDFAVFLARMHKPLSLREKRVTMESDRRL